MGYRLGVEENKNRETVCILVKFNPTFNFLKGDRTTFYCKALGFYHYETSAGARFSAPLFELIPNTPLDIK